MNPWRVFLQQIFLAFVFILLPSATSFAQSNPAEPMRVVLKGHDPVAYFTDKRPVKGTPNIKYDWDEGRYLFSNAKHREMFASNPDRYAPQFNGFCTAGMSKGKRFEANPEIWMIVDGKLYTFASPKAKEMAQADPGVFVRAAKNWQEKK